MFPFWEVAVAPVLQAADVRRLVEIGALRGENTRQIIDRLGPRTELHVIDPLPDFDPAEHEREFGGQYVFHRDLSLNVLGGLPPMDAALVDGDHNWYTVVNELRLLREGSRRHGAPLPVLILHDVAWPYGRRDLYYDPDTIPDEFRQEWRRKGMEPGRKGLLPFGGGLNPTMANARVEGGPRNGVRTALDDFVAEHDRPLRVVVVPIYFGLAIVAEVERLERQPALAAELDRLESPEGKDQLLQLAEDIRLQGVLFEHKVFFARQASIDRLAHRYLQHVKGALGDVGGPELDRLHDALDGVRKGRVSGDLVTYGVGTGASSVFVRAHMEANEAYDITRRLWTVDLSEAGDGLRAVRSGLEQLHLPDDRRREVHLPLGTPSDEVELPDGVALLHVGTGARGSVDTLSRLLERVAPDGTVLVDEAAGPEVEAIVAAASARRLGAEAS